MTSNRPDHLTRNRVAQDIVDLSHEPNGTFAVATLERPVAESLDRLSGRRCRPCSPPFSAASPAIASGPPPRRLEAW